MIFSKQTAFKLASEDLVLKTYASHGLECGTKNLQIYMMAEIPSNIILAGQFATRFDGFSIGSNDLIQLILGSVYFRQMCRLVSPLLPWTETIYFLIDVRVFFAAIAGSYHYKKFSYVCLSLDSLLTFLLNQSLHLLYSFFIKKP